MDLTTAAQAPVLPSGATSTRSVSRFEALSKVAAVLSVLAILVVQIAASPDMTPMLRAATAAALALGIAIGAAGDMAILAFVVAAPILPGLLWLLSGREGPVLDLVWMAGVAGALLRNVPWSRWTLPSGWRVLIGGWALVVALAWPVLELREISFDFRLLHDVGAVNSWGMSTAAQTVQWIGYVALAQLLGLVLLEWVVIRFSEAPARLPRVGHALWIGTTVASVIAVYQGTVNIHFLNGPLWADVRRAGSTMLDGNAYGLAAALAAPIGAIALRRSRVRTAGVVATLVFGVNLIGMWMSGSRTALMCAGLGIAGIAAALFLQRVSPSGDRGPASDDELSDVDAVGARARFLPSAAVAIVVAAVVLIAVSDTSGAIGRMADAVAGDGAAATLTALWDRFGYGTVAVHIFRDYPLTGVGLGSFHVIAPDYWKVMTGKILAVDNAQNWWRHELAELGLLGGAALLLWSLVIAWLVVVPRPRPDRRVASTTLKGALLGLAAASMFGVPTQNPFVLLWFFFLVGWLAATVPAAAPAVARRLDTRPLAWAAVTLLAVAYAGAHLWLARGPLDVVARAQRSGREYAVGAYAMEHLPFSGKFRWTDDRARFVLPVEGSALILRMWASHPDVAARPVTVTLRTQCGIVDQQVLKTTDPTDVAIDVPPGVTAIDLDVAVSRTWQPSTYDRASKDTRHLGVALQTDFEGHEPPLAQVRAVPLPACEAHGA